MKKALLLSASSYKDTGYLNHSKGWIKDFLGQNWEEEILFIPFAGVRRTHDEYEKKVQECLNNTNIKSIHKYKDMKEAVKNAKTIAVGGGNTFMLLHDLYKYDLVDAIREAVENGAKYFGWSAGANIAGSTMMTTNDMPIIMPKSFDSFNLFPHQINPHFISGKISGHNGESREERLEEFLIVNQQSTIYALPEGTALLINGNEVELIGHSDALKFEYKKDIATVKLGEKFKI
ncbi:dipeptidase PepE [Campylobacter geochelonis]|uniref:Peptidase E n=1 Tax=Campylobacter geochelonis TaxID=1780362 RepID=A0A128EA00_9BACT|nr:dipeptidase PepE [Campylobacter geochelonis]QKF72057.1 (alpha)-aspartyl dipeptidase (peptidase E) [Campylobacter geochelonis]CZE45814.1 peptidase E [Campylobacter geochelonis]CZE46820.1 peptidase E [Campylobacter geochelonis]CZE49856.1 peptidase E [Campylobacter geochelonis]